MLNQSKLRKKVNKLLKELNFEGSFDSFRFVEKLGEQLNLKIKLQSVPMPPGFFGFWSLINDCHVILYRANTSWFHQQQIIFHECGHICLGHHSGSIEKFLKREILYSEPEEQEAETFATLLLCNAITQGLTEQGISLSQYYSQNSSFYNECPQDVISMQDFMLQLKEVMEMR